MVSAIENGISGTDGILAHFIFIGLGTYSR